MPDDPAATATPEPVKEPEKTPEPQAEKPLGEAGEKALEAWKQRAKEAEAAAKAATAKAQEYEERDKSELEKLTGKISRAEAKAQEAESKLLRYEVAADKKVPAEAASFLQGNTREELEASADSLLELVKKNGNTPDFDGGTREPAPSPETPEEAHSKLLADLFGFQAQT